MSEKLGADLEQRFKSIGPLLYNSSMLSVMVALMFRLDLTQPVDFFEMLSEER